MKMKGSYYVLESIIAIVIMVTTVAFVLQKPPESLELSYVNYKQDAYNGLKISEEVGNLRKNALNGDASSIKSDLSSYMPISYDVAIFNQTSNLTAVPSLDSENIITVSYFIAGRMGNYTPREIRVYMWGI